MSFPREHKLDEHPKTTLTKKRPSLFRRMREATTMSLHPRNYASFHTVCDTDSYQGNGNTDAGSGHLRSSEPGVGVESTQWESEWIKNQSIETVAMPVPVPIKVQEMNTKAQRQTQVRPQSDVENHLRQENEQLKKRLNAANNAIRDLQNVCRNTCAVLPPSSVRSSKARNTIFSKFLGRKNKDGDDRSAYSAAVSQASTVQMGSSKKSKLSSHHHHRHHHQRNKNKSHSYGEGMPKVKDKHGRNTPPKILCLGSCSKNLILGPALRKKASSTTGTGNASSHNLITTPPCTPERMKSDEEATSKSVPVDHILSDLTLGIAKRDIPRDEKQKKLFSLAILSNRKCGGGKGSYPVDLQQANPIFDDDDDSDGNEGDFYASDDDDIPHLPVIYEYGTDGERSSGSEDSRVEI